MIAFLARGIGLHEEKNLEEKKKRRKKKQSENVLWICKGPFFTYSSRVEKNIHFHDAILFILKIFFSFLASPFFLSEIKI